MGRGRTSFISQGKSKIKKECGPLPKGDRELFRLGQRNPANQNIADIPEELLNQLRYQYTPNDNLAFSLLHGHTFHKNPNKVYIF